MPPWRPTTTVALSALVRTDSWRSATRVRRLSKIATPSSGSSLKKTRIVLHSIERLPAPKAILNGKRTFAIPSQNAGWRMPHQAGGIRTVAAPGNKNNRSCEFICTWPNKSGLTDMNVLVFDIETVPDVVSGRRLHHLEGLSDKEVAEVMFHARRQETGGSDFLRLHLQRIVAISAVLRSREHLKVWSLGEP